MGAVWTDPHLNNKTYISSNAIGNLNVIKVRLYNLSYCNKHAQNLAHPRNINLWHCVLIRDYQTFIYALERQHLKESSTRCLYMNSHRKYE